MKNEYLGQGQPMLLNMISRETLSSDDTYLLIIYLSYKNPIKFSLKQL